MQAIEKKIPQTFVSKGGVPVVPPTATDEWGTECRYLKGSEYAYALGRGGLTRKKLAKASGCILEYVGQVRELQALRPVRTARAFGFRSHIRLGCVRYTVI